MSSVRSVYRVRSIENVNIEIVNMSCYIVSSASEVNRMRRIGKDLFFYIGNTYWASEKLKN